MWAGCAKGEGKRIACPLHFARAVHAKTHNQKGAGRPQRAAQQTAVHKGWSLQTGEPAEIAPRERPGSANGAPEIYDLLIRKMTDKMPDNACPHSAHCSTLIEHLSDLSQKVPFAPNGTCPRRCGWLLTGPVPEGALTRSERLVYNICNYSCI